MNCSKARNILDCVMDGLEHSRECDAREHLKVCSSCHDWYIGVEVALRVLETTDIEFPELDMVSMLTAKLPSHHPSSVKSPAVRRSCNWVLILAGTSWFIGSMVLLLLAFVGVLWAVYAPSVHLHGGIGLAFFVLSSLAVFIKALFQSVVMVFSAFPSILLTGVILYCSMILITVSFWQRRRLFARSPHAQG